MATKKGVPGPADKETAKADGSLLLFNRVQIKRKILFKVEIHNSRTVREYYTYHVFVWACNAEQAQCIMQKNFRCRKEWWNTATDAKQIIAFRANGAENPCLKKS